MRWADNKYPGGMRKLAEPKSKGYCPLCNQEVISKCGNIKIWHWSHKSNFECDSFKEPESEWHINWKNKFPKECQEVIIGKHRADIRTKNRLIIELQNSPISSKEIFEREQYYKKMIWILNGKTLASNFYFWYQKRSNQKTFNWKWFPKSWSYAKKKIYIDIGNKTLFLIEITVDNSFGEGTLLSKDAFIVNHGGKP